MDSSNAETRGNVSTSKPADGHICDTDCHEDQYGIQWHTVEGLSDDPWEGFTGQSQADADDALITDPLVRQISELRAALADSEARRAELEALIAKVRDRIRVGMIGPLTSAQTFDLLDVLDLARSVVLEDRDREVAARAVEAAAGAIWPDRGPDDAYRASVWLRARAAAIRKGDTNA